MTGKERELLTISEAAKRLGVSTNTMRAWADRGLVPVVKLPSGHRRFEVSAMEQKRKDMGFTEREA
ncbi:MAG: MerR family DNA-binding transcriptional regulator [Dehalococcoidia bacterium]